ncbi:TIGR00730 family Rossman fold protein [Streptomyces sp. NPDC051976]|uniref:LOG family protein n=1 Tax=Streptomyces sp. NPDC051976 TaxID=3154947 RepID=UPI003444E452
MPESDGLRIAVFCGARSGTVSSSTEAAREVGLLIGKRGHSLVYGAGGIGLMGEVAWAAHEQGAAITGIVPGFLRELEKDQAAPEQELIVTGDMFDRKREMFDRADCFLALPGGYGTLDEVIEVISHNYLGRNPRPLVLLDTDGEWTPLAVIIQDMITRGFADELHETHLLIAHSPLDAVDTLEQQTRAVACPAS